MYKQLAHLCHSVPMTMKQQKRELNCHTLEDGRRKTNEEVMEIAAHAIA